MEDYEYYHAQGAEDHVDPHKVRLPQSMWYEIRHQIHAMNLTRDRLEDELATALFTLRQRNLRDRLAQE